MTKPRVATVWLDGCSGCHMSLVDLDEPPQAEVAARLEGMHDAVTLDLEQLAALVHGQAERRELMQRGIEAEDDNAAKRLQQILANRDADRSSAGPGIIASARAKA